MEVPPRGIHSSLNLPGTSASHSKPQTGTTLHHPLESTLEGEKKVSRYNRFSSKRYLQGGWCLALAATATRHGESPISLSFAICAAWIPIFHLAGEYHNHQATGYSGLRNGGHSDHLSWKLFFTGGIETLINRGRKYAKERVTHI